MEKQPWTAGRIHWTGIQLGIVRVIRLHVPVRPRFLFCARRDPTHSPLRSVVPGSVQRWTHPASPFTRSAVFSSSAAISFLTSHPLIRIRFFEWTSVWLWMCPGLTGLQSPAAAVQSPLRQSHPWNRSGTAGSLREQQRIKYPCWRWSERK